MNKYVYNSIEDIPYYYCTNEQEIKHFLKKRMDLRGVEIPGILTVLYPICDKLLPIDKHGVYWVCSCKCGRYTILSHEQLRKNQFHSCGCSNMLGVKKSCGHGFLDVTGQLFGNLEAICRIGLRNGHSVWKFKNIITGESKDIVLSNVLRGDSTGSRNKSIGEDIIQKFFDEHNINYEIHKRFTDCKFPDTNAYAEFDFYLPDINTIIEYDGIQHYKPISFGGKDPIDSYKYIQDHDKYKGIYCINKGIDLIRIPFLMSNDDISNYLLSVLKIDK